MKPWEKRLQDLSQLLYNCHLTYHEPNLFRMNTNLFLQTSRTVTFIIQKHKAAIPGYATWYDKAVVTPWGSDEVMQWAKDARNTIEKEGDLELNSTLSVKLIYSYLEENDIPIQCDRAELLTAGIKKLVSHAQKILPIGVADAAAIRIARQWVTSSLPNWELLHALVYVYGRIFDCCQSLAMQFGDSIDERIKSTYEIDHLRNEVLQVRYLKLNGYKMHSIKSELVEFNRAWTVPTEFQTKFETLKSDQKFPNTFQQMFDYYVEMASFTFGRFGNHVPMLLLVDEQWRPIDIMGTRFDDQADKFIFWRNVAERIVSLNAFGMVWISESWLRKMRQQDTVAIRNLPIIGEQLNIISIDKTGNKKFLFQNILRNPETNAVTLKTDSESQKTLDNSNQYFLIPSMRALGLPNNIAI